MLHQFFTRQITLTLVSGVLLSSCSLPFLGGNNDPDLTQPLPTEKISESPVGEKATEHVEIISPMPPCEGGEKNRSKQGGCEVGGENKNESEVLSIEEKNHRADILTTQGAYLAASNDFAGSLRLFEEAISLSPSAERERKMAHVAFRSKVFQRSSDLYKKNLNSLSVNEKKEFMQSLRYTGDDEFQVALSNISIPDYLRSAFEVSWTCEREFISCEKTIREYKYDYEIIRELKKTLDNYETLKTKDPSYKEALLAGVWYKYGDYTVAIKVGQNIIKTKPDYRPVLKIIGLSSFMIGKYDDALSVLANLKQLEPKDPEVDFLLGLINFEKGDFRTANIYLENALKSGYKDKALLQRKLAYSYASLDMKDLMYNVLSNLISSKESNEMDITNALYIALNDDKLAKANTWIGTGTSRFPDSTDIMAMKGWYLRLSGKKDESRDLFTEILEENPNQLTTLVQMGILYTESGEKNSAKNTFEKAKVIDAGGTWTEEIDKYLQQLGS